MSMSFPPPPEAPRKAKPVWRRWWFWAAVAVVVLVAAGLTAPANESATGSGSPVVTQSSTPQPTAVSQTTAPSAPETARVPGVTGKRVETARSKIVKAGFVVQVETKLTNAAPAGTVLHQTHSGERAEVGVMITLTVAKALPKIPGVVGESVTKAKATLKRAGFQVGKVTQQVSSQPKGTILSQSPAAGSSAYPGRAVALVVAKPAPQPTSNCTPGYSPCLVYHNGADYDCAGGSGDGPYYTVPGVTYRVTGSDPYGLDADNNGYGCE
jgi:serine/threonine-protein kinase